MHGPDPAELHPMEGFPQVVYIANCESRPNIHIGEYTYCDSPDAGLSFFDNVLYHYPFVGDRLCIGKYCAISRDVQFIMNGANHALDGFSTYPFHIFGKGWEGAAPGPERESCKGDTVVGNDVWIGYGATIMPGVHIGDGAIVAAKALVSRNVPPYAVVAGNPARLVRERFAPEIVRQLLQIAWWDWPADKVTRNLAAITGADLAALLVAR